MDLVLFHVGAGLLGWSTVLGTVLLLELLHE
jgi:hypothetical protein